MLVSELKPLPEILSAVKDEQRLFLVGCKGCAEGCQTGGEAQVSDMTQKLTEAGKEVVGHCLIDMVCNESLVKMRLLPHQAEIASADSVMVLSCGIGIQVTADAVDRVVHPGCNTVSLGGQHAEWRQSERCLECGHCLLDYTGGICPIARCAKNLLNGPCGGSVNGKCEISPELPCAWQLIIDRLTKLGRLDKLAEIPPVKDWSVSLTGGPPTTRKL